MKRVKLKSAPVLEYNLEFIGYSSSEEIIAFERATSHVFERLSEGSYKYLGFLLGIGDNSDGTITPVVTYDEALHLLF